MKLHHLSVFSRHRSSLEIQSPNVSKTLEVTCKWTLRWWWWWWQFEPQLFSSLTGQKVGWLNWLDQNKHFQGWLQGLPSPSLQYCDPGFILTMDKGGYCLWLSFGFFWLSDPLPLPLPHAKCRVCEDMQVARCLCNFSSAPFERQAPCNSKRAQSCLYQIGPGLKSRGS